MGWQEGAGFRICGTVKRIFVSDRKKFAKVTLKVNMPPHPPELDLKCMDRVLVGDIEAQLKPGMRVQFLGQIQSEKVTERNGDEIKNAAGYAIWVPVLRPASFEVEGSSLTPGTRGGSQPAGKKSTEREPGGDDGDPMSGADPMGGGSDPFGG